MSVLSILIKFISKLAVYPRPGFFLYNPPHYLINGEDMRKVLDIIEPGDIIARRYRFFLSSMMVPGYWSHVGIYIGDNKIVHAVGEGVIEEDILTFLRTDCIAVLRPKRLGEKRIKKAIDFAKEEAKKNTPYDYEFDFQNKRKYEFSCTELANKTFDNLFEEDFEQNYGKDTLTPDGICCSKKVKNILEIKKD